MNTLHLPQSRHSSSFPRVPVKVYLLKEILIFKDSLTRAGLPLLGKDSILSSIHHHLGGDNSYLPSGGFLSSPGLLLHTKPLLS
jgi:hypothetical protein